MAMDVAWYAEDLDKARLILEAWQDATGYLAPREGVVFIEPELAEMGESTMWIAAAPRWVDVGYGYAGPSDPPRTIHLQCLLYTQMGQPIATNWLATLVAAVETLDLEPWMQFHPLPSPTLIAQMQTQWQLTAAELRFKVG